MNLADEITDDEKQEEQEMVTSTELLEVLQKIGVGIASVVKQSLEQKAPAVPAVHVTAPAVHVAPAANPPANVEVKESPRPRGATVVTTKADGTKVKHEITFHY